MSLQSLQHPLFRALEKLLLFRHVSVIDSETDVHSTANALVGDDLVDIWVRVEDFVEDGGFRVGYGFLAGYFCGGMREEERAHHFACDPDAEDWHGVQEGIVFGDDGPFEDGGG